MSVEAAAPGQKKVFKKDACRNFAIKDVCSYGSARKFSRAGEQKTKEAVRQGHQEKQ
jgi:hypothetical protein